MPTTRTICSANIFGLARGLLPEPHLRCFLFWAAAGAATAQLTGAVIASGSVTVDENLKIVSSIEMAALSARLL